MIALNWNNQKYDFEVHNKKSIIASQDQSIETKQNWK